METVTLGDHKFVVTPQRHARLRRYLGANDLRLLVSGNYGHEAYKLLTFLIPTIDPAAPYNRDNGGGMPEWEFEGYKSEEAWKNDDYDEAADRSPTTAEIVEAFNTCLNVNGWDKLGKIGEMVRLGLKASEGQKTTTPRSPASRGESGE